MASENIEIGFNKFVLNLNEDERKALVFIIATKENPLEEPITIYHKYNKITPIDRPLFLTVYNSVNHGKLEVNPTQSGMSKLGITPLFAQIIDFMTEDSNEMFITRACSFVNNLTGR